MSASKRVLLTGGYGFIGAQIVRRLLDEGHDVYLMELASADPGRLKDVRANLHIREVDLKDGPKVLATVKETRPDTILHLATYYTIDHKPFEVPLMVDTNVLGISNLLEAAREADVKHFINASSCFVYEQTGKPLRESGELKPVNFYAMTKKFSEEACSHYCDNYGLRATTLRIFSPYGPGDHERRLIPSVIKSFHAGEAPKVSTGKQEWDFVYLDDIVDAFALAVTYSPKGHEAFNVASGKAVAVRDIVLHIRKLMGSKLEPLWGAVPHRKSEVWKLTADISKAKAKLGWKPKTDIFKDGLEKTVDWFVRRFGGDAK